MNKKFLSAILFGALAVASTGSFVSCKDYDDDIDNLQSQINQLATKSDLQSQVSTLESSLASAKSSAESAVTTAQKAVEEAKAAADKAAAAQGAAGDAQTAANAAADAVKAAEAKLEAAEKKLADIEAELAAVKSLKADLEAYTENEVAKLQKEIAAEIEKFKEEAKELVGLHYVDLMINPAKKEEKATVNWAKFAPKANNTAANYLANYKKTLLVAFPELADLEGQELNTTSQISMVVSPAIAQLMPEYTYELIGEDEKAIPVALSDPKQGMTRASGSEYWTLEVAPTFDEKGQPNKAKGTYALRVSEGEEVLYKTMFAFKADVNEAVDVTVTPCSPETATVEYASEIELVNSEVIEYKYTDAEGNKVVEMQKFFAIASGLKDYYVITVDDVDNSFACEKYGISVNGSKLVIKNMPENVASVTVKLSIVALGINGSTETAEKNLTITNGVKSTVELEAKSFEIGNNKTYKLYYNVEDLGWTPSQVYANSGAAVAIYDAEGKVVADAAILSFADANKAQVTPNTEANAKKVKYVVVDVTGNGNNFKAGDYTVEITVEESNVVTFKATGDLTAVNPGAAIKLVEALVKDGVLQAVGEVDANGVVTYDVEKALILTNATLADGTVNDADGNVIATLVDNDATEAENWVSEVVDNKLVAKTNTAVMNVYNNGKHQIWTVEGEDIAEFEFDHINKTVRNMTVNYYIGTNKANIQSFDFKVMVISPIYSEDPTKVITVADQTIYFADAAQAAAKAATSFEVNKLISKAVYAAGKNMGQAYNPFNTYKAGDKDSKVLLVNYGGNLYSKALNSYAAADATVDTTVKFYTDSTNVLIKFTKTELGDMLDADAKNFAHDELYLAIDGNIYYLKDSKLIKDAGKLNKTIAQYQAAWLLAYETKTENNVTRWVCKWTADQLKTDTDAQTKVKDAAPFESIKTKFEAEWFTDKYSAYTTAGDPTISNAAESKIASIVVKFDDPATAAKFLDLGDNTEAKFENITAGEGAVKISAKASTGEGIQSSITGGSVDIPGTITIKDVYGLEMKLTFKVTAKIYK